MYESGGFGMILFRKINGSRQMKTLMAIAFAFAGLTACASESTERLSVGEDFFGRLSGMR